MGVENMKMDEETLVSDDDQSMKESKKKKSKNINVEKASKKTLTSSSKTEILKKETEVLTDSLKILKSMKLKLKTTEREAFVSNFKKTFNGINSWSPSTRSLAH